jgi:Flp pilus assembly secretin CpaC
MSHGKRRRCPDKENTDMLSRYLFPAALLFAATAVLADPPQAASGGDASVTAQVKAAIGRTPGLGKLAIQVSTVDGVVHLKGSVPSSVQSDQAEDVTSRVSGVREVDNQLRPAHS